MLMILVQLARELRTAKVNDATVWPAVLEFKALGDRAARHSDIGIRKAAKDELQEVTSPNLPPHPNRARRDAPRPSLSRRFGS